MTSEAVKAIDLVREFLANEAELRSAGGDGEYFRSADKALEAFATILNAAEAQQREIEELQRDTSYRSDVQAMMQRDHETELRKNAGLTAEAAALRERVAELESKLCEWADDFEAAAKEVLRGIRSTILMTRAQECRALTPAAPTGETE